MTDRFKGGLATLIELLRRAEGARHLHQDRALATMLIHMAARASVEAPDWAQRLADIGVALRTAADEPDARPMSHRLKHQVIAALGALVDEELPAHAIGERA